MNNYDYPAGADINNAPWNEKEYPEREIEVTVSVTLSKTVKIKVNDYDVELDADEDGKYVVYNFNNCDLEGAVKEQVLLPQDTIKDWIVDEFEVVRE